MINQKHVDFGNLNHNSPRRPNFNVLCKDTNLEGEKKVVRLPAFIYLE